MEPNDQEKAVCKELQGRLASAKNTGNRWQGPVEALGSVNLSQWCASILRQQDAGAFVAMWNQTLCENSSNFNGPKRPAEDCQEKGKKQRRGIRDLLEFVCKYVDVEKWKEKVVAVGLNSGMANKVKKEVRSQHPRSVFQEWMTGELDGALDQLVINFQSGCEVLWLSAPNKWRELLERSGILAIGTTDQLVDVLKKTIPKRPPLVDGLAVEEYNLEYVATTPARQEWQSKFDQEDNDKMQVKVVAGESGAGKTVFSTLAPQGAILFGKPGTASDDASDDASAAPPVEGNGQLDAFHKCVTQLLGQEKVKGRCRSVLTATNAIINFHRNDHAWHKADKIWFDALEMASRDFGGDVCLNTVRSWWKGNVEGDLSLPKLTLVMDEASELSFGRAMVDIGRYFCRSCESRHLADSVDLVIVGTGLERVVKQDIGGKRYGTDPDKFFLIKVGMPLPDKVLHNTRAYEKEALEAALAKGVFSRILKANSRMLFRAVLPVLKHKVHLRGMNDMSYSLADKLTKIGSFDGLMDYAVRVYLSQNSVGSLQPSEQRDRLKAAFYYHLRSSQEELLLRCGNQDWWFLMPKKPKLDELREHVFDVGLARSDGHTSPALKYLACCGRTNMLEISDGTSFEMLLANHLTRFVQVRDGTRCQMHGKLVSAWPPAFTSSDKEHVKTVNGLTNVVKQRIGQHSTEEALCDRIEKMATEPEGFAVVFLQGGTNAQGPDVFLLQVRWEDNEAFGVLHCFQCKNYSSSVGARGWKSLGVAQNGQQLRTTPTSGDAAYSLAGIKLLAICIEKHTSLKKVGLGQRVLAYSGKGETDPKVELAVDCKIICRELLEPSFSCWEYKTN